MLHVDLSTTTTSAVTKKHGDLDGLLLQCTKNTDSQTLLSVNHHAMHSANEIQFFTEYQNYKIYKMLNHLLKK